MKKVKELIEKLAFGYATLEEVLWLIENLSEDYPNYEFWIREIYESYNQLLFQKMEEITLSTLN